MGIAPERFGERIRRVLEADPVVLPVHDCASAGKIDHEGAPVKLRISEKVKKNGTGDPLTLVTSEALADA
jgi:hypothetical protein